MKALTWPVIRDLHMEQKDELQRKTMKEDQKQLKCGVTKECCG